MQKTGRAAGWRDVRVSYIHYSVCQQNTTEDGNHSQQQLIMPLQPVRSSWLRYSSSFLVLFHFIFAFAELKNAMNTGITLLVFHSMTSQLNVGNVFAHVCVAFLIDELRDSIRSG